MGSVLQNGKVAMTAISHMLRDDVDSFYTLDTGVIKRATSRFVSGFCGKVLYAVKANPMPSVLQAVLDGGASGFDVASLSEAVNVKHLVSGDNCYFMNPVKGRRDIDYAYRELGIKAYVVDSPSELTKIFDVLPHNDEAIIVFLRFAIIKSSAVFDLSSKFGANVSDVLKMGCLTAKTTSWRLGITFHVGSQSTDCRSFIDAIDISEAVICEASFAIHALDIGGGFPGYYLNSDGGDLYSTLDNINCRIRASNVLSRLEIFCEPGRALVYPSMSLFTRIQLRKGNSLYITDGIYGGLLSAQQWLQLPIRVWRHGSPLINAEENFQIFGPTCDSLDKLGFIYELPSNVTEGDWLEVGNVGAYSVSLRTRFNGFYTETILPVDESSSIYSCNHDQNAVTNCISFR